MSTAPAQTGTNPTIKLPFATWDGDPISPTVALRDYEAILKLTAETFSTDRVSITREFDPEIAGKEYWVVSVKTQGEVPELLARDTQWHQRKWDVAPETACYYCLALDLG
jgi:hypothetical protein